MAADKFQLAPHRSTRCVATSTDDSALTASRHVDHQLAEKRLPIHAPEQLVLEIGHLGQLTPDEIEAIVERFNTIGAVILRPTRRIPEAQDFLSLERLFGGRVGHEKMRSTGFVVIDPKAPNSVNVKAVTEPHRVHTDEAYSDNASRVQTLHCRTPALSGGGKSTLVCGAAMRGLVCDTEAAALSKRAAMTIGRTLPGEKELKRSDVPIFTTNPSGRTELRWRCLDTYVLAMSPDAEAALRRMDAYAQTPRNQLTIAMRPGDTLVLDNRSHAHGRTPYLPGEDRVFWRLNFDGVGGSLSGRLTHGFAPALPSSRVSKL